MRAKLGTYVGAAVVVLALLAAILGPRYTPAGQPWLRDVSALPGAFAEAPGPVVLALLSPTCATCLRTAENLDAALHGNPDPTLRVFVVWTRVLRGDIVGPTQTALKRLSDSRVRQFVDRQDTLAATLCRSAEGAEMCTLSPVLDGFVGFYPSSAHAALGKWPAWAAFDEAPPQLWGG